MFVSKMAINTICKLHYRTLKVVYNEYDKSNEELREMNKSASIHQRHLQFLAIEVYKPLMHLKPGFMWSYFSEKNYFIILEMETASNYRMQNRIVSE